jgi:hypothetical protein
MLAFAKTQTKKPVNDTVDLNSTSASENAQGPRKRNLVPHLPDGSKA